MTSYARHASTKTTPQSQPIPGTAQVQNSAGGYVFEASIWDRLDRLLILGAVGNTFYATEQKSVLDGLDAIKQCLKADGARTVFRITEVSDKGLAPKNDPAIFALAVALKLGDEATRRLAAEAVPSVCRIGTHIFQLAETVKQLGGWGRATTRAFSSWYNEQEPDRLALNLLKYKQREGWSHKDLLLKAHVGKQAPSEAHRALYSYVVRSGDLSARTVKRKLNVKGQAVEQETAYEARSVDALPRLVSAAEEVAAVSSEAEVCRLIIEHRLPRELIPTWWLKSPAVWDALLHFMPPHAMLRNLGKMSSLEMLNVGSDATRRVVAALGNADRIRAARLHPLTILMAQKQYALGRGDKGKLSWRPTPAIVNALEEAFYLGFAAVTPTNKRWCLALDVSGSMATGAVGGYANFSPREAAAAMALTIANVEPHYHTIAFTAQGYGGASSMHPGYPACVSDLSLYKRMTIAQAINAAEKLKMGGTDCALPMLWATKNNLAFDVFVVMTDNETWANPAIHPSQALRRYREAMGIDAKLIVMGLVSNAFSIADPNDHGSLDICGFSADVPQVMSSFVTGIR